jgi:hypothetical protein
MSSAETNPPKNFFKENPGNHNVFESIKTGFERLTTLNNDSDKDGIAAHLNDDFLNDIEKIGKIFDLIKKKEGGLLSETENAEIAMFTRDKALLTKKKQKYSKEGGPEISDGIKNKDIKEINDAIQNIKSLKEKIETFLNDYIKYKNA